MYRMHSRIGWQTRVKNPWFWIGLCSVILTALQIEPDSLTSWREVWVAIVETVESPGKLTTVVMAVMGMLTDYTKPATALAEAVVPADLVEAIAEVVAPGQTVEPKQAPAVVTVEQL